jgi:hypothetical protein
MTDCQFLATCSVLQCRLSKQSACSASQGGTDSFPALLRKIGRNCKGLLWPVAFKDPIGEKLLADDRFVSIQQLGVLSLIMSDFHKGLDQIPFNLAEMFIVHGQLRLAGQEALNAKHSQPSSL